MEFRHFRILNGVFGILMQLRRANSYKCFEISFYVAIHCKFYNNRTKSIHVQLYYRGGSDGPASPVCNEKLVPSKTGLAGQILAAKIGFLCQFWLLQNAIFKQPLL